MSGTRQSKRDADVYVSAVVRNGPATQPRTRRSSTSASGVTHERRHRRHGPRPHRRPRRQQAEVEALRGENKALKYMVERDTAAIQRVRGACEDGNARTVWGGDSIWLTGTYEII